MVEYSAHPMVELWVEQSVLQWVDWKVGIWVERRAEPKVALMAAM